MLELRIVLKVHAFEHFVDCRFEHGSLLGVISGSCDNFVNVVFAISDIWFDFVSIKSRLSVSEVLQGHTESFLFRLTMQVDHPRNSVFIVSSAEDIFSGPRASLEKKTFELIDLLFNLIDLGPLSLHAQLLLLLVTLRNFLSQRIFFFLSLFKE